MLLQAGLVFAFALQLLGELLSPQEIRSPGPADDTAVVVPSQRDQRLFWGQEPPGRVPVPFAPAVLVAGQGVHSVLAFDQEGSRLLWTKHRGEPGRWLYSSAFDGINLGPAEVLQLASDFNADGVAIAPDGRRLFIGGPHADSNDGEAPWAGAIWTAERAARGEWSTWRPVTGTLGPSWYANSPTVSQNGNLYFRALDRSGRGAVLYVCRYAGGEYLPPEELRGGIQNEPIWDFFVDPEERIILFTGRNHPDATGMVDLFISYREGDGSWTGGENITPALGQGPEAFLRFPSLSPDGQFLFFVGGTQGATFPTAETSYYWVSADVLPARARR